MIGRIDPEASNGDLVAVYDRDGKRFGSGLLSTQSQIGLRMLTFDDSPIDESFLLQRLEAAARLRQEYLKLDAVTDAYRVVHAEGDALPTLMIDKLGDYAVVELFSFPMYRRFPEMKEDLKRILNVKHVLARADERVQASEGFSLAEDSPLGAKAHRSPDRKSTIVTENSVRFQIDLTHGHKTGFFCDQRDNRMLLTQFTHAAEMLDLCCYSGGFGVYASVLGKAKHVTAVDLDEDAIALARRNANLNKVPAANYETIHSDTFPYLRQSQAAGKRFDVIVLDPPKLIPTKEDFFEGRGKYFDMNKLALGSVKPGGMLLTCSCSGLMPADEFFNVLKGAARSANRRVQVIRATGPGADHPVMTEHPESAYLKALWCRVM
jgi:23S rRNA (cytosine1962-C5)-methyltransferase